MGFTVAEDGGGRLPGRGKQQALSIRRAAREPDLTLCAGLLLPTQLHFDIGDLWVSDRNHISTPLPPGFPPISQQESLRVEGVSAFCCPLLGDLECGRSEAPKQLVGQGAVLIGSRLCGQSSMLGFFFSPKTNN